MKIDKYYLKAYKKYFLYCLNAMLLSVQNLPKIYTDSSSVINYNIVIFCFIGVCYVTVRLWASNI